MKKRIQCFSLRLFCLILFIASFGFASQGILAQTFVASDNASNYVDWTQGSNEGYGFGNWNLDAVAGTGYAGWFLGNPNDAGISGLPNPTFGLFANPAGSGAFINADRNLAYPLPVGATLSFMWGVNWDSDGEGNKGINLYVGGVGGTQVININQGGSAAITINGNPIFNQYGTQAMTLNFERTSATQLRVYGLGRDGAEVYDNTFALTSSAIDAIRFYAHNLAGGDNRQPYFNNIRISFPQNHTLNDNAIVSAVEITGGTIFGTGTNTLSVGPGGFFTNNGMFEPGTGTVIFTGSATLGGSAATSFYHLVLDAGDGNGVDFGSGLCEVLHEFELRSGFVDTHAPSLAEESTLFYATNGSYVREIEWNNPWHVRLGFVTLLDLNMNGWGGDISIGGNLTIDENSALSIDAGPQPWDLIINGNLSLSGTLALSTSFGRDLQIRGDWHQTGTLAHNQREVIINGTSMQQIQIHNPVEFSYLRINNPGGEVILQNDIVITNRIEIDPQATFNMQDKIISGVGQFIFHNEGILKIGHPEGISTVANTGNVQVTGAKTFASAATYNYIGQANQYSGDALPTASVPITLIVELGEDEYTFRINTDIAILISSPGRLEIRSGTVVESTSFSEGRSISGTGDLIMSGGVYRFERTTVSTGQTYPRLTGNYALTGGVVELAGNTDSEERIQSLRGGETYYTVRIAGSSANGGYKTHSSLVIINGSFEITNDNVYEARNNALRGPGDLIMNSGLLRIPKLTETQPELTGDYFLSGGTIELFGTGSTQNQTLRGGRIYHNIEINANAANPYGDGGNVNIPSSITVNGIMNVNAPACFQTAYNNSVQGFGAFRLNSGAWLRYGNANGITQVGNTGNIRTANRLFSSGAGYVLISASNMVTGDALPTFVNSLAIEKPNGYTVTLSQELNVLNQLRLTNGLFRTNENQLYLLSANWDALIAGPGNEKFQNSFIEGVFRRGISENNPGAFVFPVGKNGALQTASITITDGPANSGTPISLIAEFIDVLPENYYGNLPIISNNIPINTLAQRGFWRIEAPDDLGALTYNLELFANGFPNIVFPHLVSVIKRPQGSDEWEQAGESMSSSGGEMLYRFQSFAITSGFSEFALGSTFQSNPLPVEWLSFTARNLGQEVLLQWQTATETNNSHFSILRSANGTDYALLDVLQGAGNSNKPLTYSFTDTQAEGGLNYYKIRQTDFDGQTQFSTIQVVNFSPRFAAIISYHNGRLHFHLPESNVSAWNYQLVDLQGNILLQGAFETSTGNRNFSVDVSWLNSRLFMVVLRSHDHMQTEKFLIGH